MTDIERTGADGVLGKVKMVRSQLCPPVHVHTASTTQQNGKWCLESYFLLLLGTLWHVPEMTDLQVYHPLSIISPYGAMWGTPK